jgi:dTDP-4-dehydrorhamnose reductase
MTQQRVLLLGANGQVGTELRTLLESRPGAYQLHTLTRAEADFAQPEQLRSIVAAWQPSIILNAAAYTAVDRAESEPEAATLVNARSPGILGEEAARIGALLVHYSTDYVFDGSKKTAWLEDDKPAPLSVYGATKLAGEKAIVASGAHHLIFRTSWVFAPHGKNFMLTILRLARERDRLTIVADQSGAPTSAAAIATATLQVLEKIRDREAEGPATYSGTYHMTCAGKTTWYEFAQAIVAEASTLLNGKLPEIAPISSGDYPTPATRPSNSVLDNAKLLSRFGVALPKWRDALREAVQKLTK